MAKLNIPSENVISSFKKENKKPQIKKEIFREIGHKTVDIEIIKRDPNQPRKIFNQETINELAESIKTHGLLNPVLLRQDEGGDIYLVAGERRLRAAKIAGLKTIDGIFNPAWKHDEVAIIENIQREDLNPVEEAMAYESLLNKYNYTHGDLSKILNKDRSDITNILSINKLPESIKKDCCTSNISKRGLIEISRIKSEEEKIKLYEKVKNDGLTVREIEKIKKKLSPIKKKDKKEENKKKLIKEIRKVRSKIEEIDFENIEENIKIELLQEINELSKLFNEIKMMNLKLN